MRLLTHLARLKKLSDFRFSSRTGWSVTKMHVVAKGDVRQEGL